MNVWQLKEYFDEKIAHMPPADEGEELDAAHVFLKFVLSTEPDCSDPVIGHFEMQNRGIKYDGYYLNEDEKEFHVLSLLYFDDLDALTEQKVVQTFNLYERGALNFVEAAIKGKSNIATDTEVGEHVQELIDCFEQGCNVVLDFYCNVDMPENAMIKSIEVGRKKIVCDYHTGNSIVERIKDDETDSLIVELKKQYGEPLTALRVSRNESFDVYMTAISGVLLSKIYNDHKNRLMDGNVRAYLKRTQKTNKKIAETIRYAPQDFIALNNGLAVVASGEGSDVSPLGDNVYLIRALDKMQIVNGGQTTVTVYEMFKEDSDLSEVMVPVKITMIKRQSDEAEIVTNIAISANTQTAIAKSDLASNKPFYKSFEALSLHTPCYRTPAHNQDDAYYWFFERANGMYNTRKRIIWNYSKSFTRHFPEKKKFSKKALAKAIMAFAARPDVVCLGNEKCFSTFNEAIDKNLVMPDNIYYKNAIGALILWKDADAIIGRLKLPIKAAVLPYTIAYISDKTKGLLNLQKIWDDQKIDDSLKQMVTDVAKAVSAYFQSVLEEHPNTLMWGRKAECWKTVKTLSVPTMMFYELSLGSSPCNFFPENPVSAFINDSRNLNNVELWIGILAWTNQRHVLSNKESESIGSFINSIRVSLKISQYEKPAAVRIFIKCVQNGYQFR